MRKPNDSPAKERRKEPRYAADLPVSFAVHEIHGIRDGFLGDLSRRGARVKSSIRVELGREAAFFIHAPHDPTPIIIDMARVRWMTPHEFGLEFVIVTRAQEKERLNRLILSLARSSVVEKR